MSCAEEERQWSCGKPGVLNLQKVSSLVWELGQPCFSQSPLKVVITVGKMLNKEKWQAAFDEDGKVSGFQKALKSIVLGGVDPSIRAEVWEFLLGCYALGTSAEYRKKLRTTRRERYNDLLKLCQMMHPTIGTGTLAYVVGSKVMDMRKSFETKATRGVKTESAQASASNTNRVDESCGCNVRMDNSHAHQSETPCHSNDPYNGRKRSPDTATYNSSCYNLASPGQGKEGNEPHVAKSDSDFPTLAVSNLFETSTEDKLDCVSHDDEPCRQCKLGCDDDSMHSFRIINNADLVIESHDSPSNSVMCSIDSKIEKVRPDSNEPVPQHDNETEILNGLRIPDILEKPSENANISHGETGCEDRVSEWLWTLHCIVVDVVRTDSDLEFYEDTRNLARMCDILAVYAWVDPGTGYCQGMSDLVSPFVVLFEDNADAFWCFEMLLRRMRSNFQMEGPTGVMQQLQTLRQILQLTDRELFSHLSHIGAESLHFAFRMLLVLFRRELSFDDTLRMWEMMWAADFDDSLVCDLEESCLEPLLVKLPSDSRVEVKDERLEDRYRNSQPNNRTTEHFMSDNAGITSDTNYSFCGFTRNFWSRDGRMHGSNTVSSNRKENNYLPVFCVAAILIMNRQKIIRETRSIEDMIKEVYGHVQLYLLLQLDSLNFKLNEIFNENLLTISVRRCVTAAIRLRKKYFYKLLKSRSHSQIQNLSQTETQSHTETQINSQIQTRTQSPANL